MTSSSYMLEREILGSARHIIDANSNNPLLSTGQYSTYRSPYGMLTTAPPMSTSTICSPYGLVTTSMDNFEPRKALVDVMCPWSSSRRICSTVYVRCCRRLVARSNSPVETRSREEEHSHSRIECSQVSETCSVDIVHRCCCSHRDPSKPGHFEAARYDALVGNERASLDAARRELEQYRVKVDSLTHDVSAERIRQRRAMRARLSRSSYARQ
jgi:hypothetical protein